MNVVLMICLPLVGIVLGWIIRWLYARFQLSASEQRAERVKQDAIKEAEAQKKEILLEAKDQLIRERNQQERENRERRGELQRFERRLSLKEEALEKRVQSLDKQEQEFVSREEQIAKKEALLIGEEERYRQELERISGLTAEEASIMKKIDEYYKVADTVENIVLTNEGEEFDWTEELHKEDSGEEHIPRVIRAILKQAIIEDVHELNFEQSEDGLKVVFKQSGESLDKGTVPSILNSAFVAKLKTLSNLDPSVCEIPQLGKLCFKVDNTILIASVSCFPTIMGERISLKIYKPVARRSVAPLGRIIVPVRRMISAVRVVPAAVGVMIYACLIVPAAVSVISARRGFGILTGNGSVLLHGSYGRYGTHLGKRCFLVSLAPLGRGESLGRVLLRLFLFLGESFAFRLLVPRRDTHNDRGKAACRAHGGERQQERVERFEDIHERVTGSGEYQNDDADYKPRCPYDDIREELASVLRLFPVGGEPKREHVSEHADYTYHKKAFLAKGVVHHKCDTFEIVLYPTRKPVVFQQYRRGDGKHAEDDENEICEDTRDTPDRLHEPSPQHAATPNDIRTRAARGN